MVHLSGAGISERSESNERKELTGNSTAATSAGFLQSRLKSGRANHPGPLVVIWDNGPAHRGEEIREYLTTPGLALQLAPLPAYSPDFLVLAGGVRNPDEAIWARLEGSA